jgi:hypothetical protein
MTVFTRSPGRECVSRRCERGREPGLSAGGGGVEGAGLLVHQIRGVGDRIVRKINADVEDRPFARTGGAASGASRSRPLNRPAPLRRLIPRQRGVKESHQSLTICPRYETFRT